MSAKKLRPCKYGAECYQKNPSHFKQYSHPEKSSTSNGNAVGDQKSSNLKKRSRAALENLSDDDSDSSEKQTKTVKVVKKELEQKIHKSPAPITSQPPKKPSGKPGVSLDDSSSDDDEKPIKKQETNKKNESKAAPPSGKKKTLELALELEDSPVIPTGKATKHSANNEKPSLELKLDSDSSSSENEREGKGKGKAKGKGPAGSAKYLPSASASLTGRLKSEKNEMKKKGELRLEESSSSDWENDKKPIKQSGSVLQQKEKEKLALKKEESSSSSREEAGDSLRVLSVKKQEVKKKTQIISESKKKMAVRMDESSDSEEKHSKQEGKRPGNHLHVKKNVETKKEISFSESDSEKEEKNKKINSVASGKLQKRVEEQSSESDALLSKKQAKAKKAEVKKQE